MTAFQLEMASDRQHLRSPYTPRPGHLPQLYYGHHVPAHTGVVSMASVVCEGLARAAQAALTIAV